MMLRDDPLYRMQKQINLLNAQVKELKERESTPQYLFGWSGIISAIMAMPGLRGFWPMSVNRDQGVPNDLSNTGMPLTRNGTPSLTYSIPSKGAVIPNAIFQSAGGDYYSRADQADLDITGTDNGIGPSNRGITVGCLAWADAFTATMGLVSKWAATGNQRSYLLNWQTTGELTFSVTSDGTAATIKTATSSTAFVIDKWVFTVGRFIPSTEVNIFANGVWTPNTSSIPASAHSGTADLQVGAYNIGTQLLDGRIGFAFLSAIPAPDAVINDLWALVEPMLGDAVG